MLALQSSHGVLLFDVGVRWLAQTKARTTAEVSWATLHRPAATAARLVLNGYVRRPIASVDTSVGPTDLGEFRAGPFEGPLEKHEKQVQLAAFKQLRDEMTADKNHATSESNELI